MTTCNAELMEIINVPNTDTFDCWRQKTNVLAERQGNLTTLHANISGDNRNNLVDAINEVIQDTEDSINEVISNSVIYRRRTLANAIAMS